MKAMKLKEMQLGSVPQHLPLPPTLPFYNSLKGKYHSSIDDLVYTWSYTDLTEAVILN